MNTYKEWFIKCNFREFFLIERFQIILEVAMHINILISKSKYVISIIKHANYNLRELLILK